LNLTNRQGVSKVKVILHSACVQDQILTGYNLV